MLPRSSPPQRVGARSLPPLESNKLFVPPSYLPPTIGARIPATVPGDILSQTNGLSKLLPSALPSLPSTVTSPPPSVNAAPSVGSDSCSDGGRFAVSSHNHKTAKIPSLTRRPLVIDGFYAESQNIDAPNARTALPNSFDSPETVPFTATDASLRPLSSTTFPPSYSILDPLPSQPSVMYPRTLVSMDTTLSAAIPGSHSTIANEHVAVLSNTSTSAFSNSPTLTLTPTGPSPIPPPAFAPAQSYSFSALLAASSSAFAAPTSASVSLLAHTTSSAGTAKALPPLRAGAARLSKSVVRLET